MAHTTEPEQFSGTLTVQEHMELSGGMTTSRESYTRIHLPVALKCNVQCNYCNRKYSCVNESGCTESSEVMSPKDALEYLRQSIKTNPNIGVAGIAGPGDPFASPRETLDLIRLIRKTYPHIVVCIASNGLNVIPYVDKLKELGVSHATITVNAVDPVIGAQIYQWIHFNKERISGEKAAYTLWDYQQLAIQALSFRGINVKINTVLIPGINDTHIDTIAKTIASLGASLHSILPLNPVAGSSFAFRTAPASDLIQKARDTAKRYLPQMERCHRCNDVSRMSPSGTTSMPLSFSIKTIHSEITKDSTLFYPSRIKRSHVAVASTDGVTINSHLGQADQLRIYDLKSGKPVLIDIRKSYISKVDCMKKNWIQLAHLLSDCFLLLVNGAGPVPISILDSKGIKVKIVDDEINNFLAHIVNVNTEIIEKLYFNFKKT